MVIVFFKWQDLVIVVISSASMFLVDTMSDNILLSMSSFLISVGESISMRQICIHQTIQQLGYSPQVPRTASAQPLRQGHVSRVDGWPVYHTPLLTEI